MAVFLFRSKSTDSISQIPDLTRWLEPGSEHMEEIFAAAAHVTRLPPKVPLEC